MNTTSQDPVAKENAERTIQVCNTLLKGEISAVETYEKTIEKFPGESGIATLRTICGDHERAVGLLKNHILEVHGLPETESGAWGSITGAIQAAANFLGESSAIKSLEQGEMLGQKGYQDMLDDPEVLPDVKRTVRDLLLPMTNQHIDRLERLGKVVS